MIIVALEELQKRDADEKKRLLAPEGGMGRTLLHDVETPCVMELLVNSGADPNAKDPATGRTPIMDIVQRHNLPYGLLYSRAMVDILVGAGADLTVRDANGLSVMDCAKKKIRKYLSERYSLTM